MKAIARVFMLLICIISFTGIGNATSDLTQNSEPIELVADATHDLVSVVVTLKIIINETVFDVTKNEVFNVECLEYFGSECLRFGENIKVEEHVPPLILYVFNNNSTILKRPKNPLIEDYDWCYRKARDGLNYV